MGGQQLPAALADSLRVLARTPRLLVGCDYDGTLAEIVPDPTQAWPRAGSVAALRSLAALPATSVAVVSGRARRELAALTGLERQAVLVGSHGAELETGPPLELSPAARALLGSLHTELRRLTTGTPGVVLETKPASIAVHVRRAEPAAGERILTAVAAGPGRWDGITVSAGKAVAELGVVALDKGSAVDRLRERAAATAVLFVGDDVTDENVFARLTGSDVGVKVGAGSTRAGYRVCAPAGVTSVLTLLAERRRPA